VIGVALENMQKQYQEDIFQHQGKRRADLEGLRHSFVGLILSP
jgi:hypothetical protein